MPATMHTENALRENALHKRREPVKIGVLCDQVVCSVSASRHGSVLADVAPETARVVAPAVGLRVWRHAVDGGGERADIGF
jgi:hypothetical protein